MVLDFTEKRIVICLLAKDCRINLERNIPEIESLANCFQETVIVIVENDSTDGTGELIDSWIKNSALQIIRLKPSEDLSKLSRIERMVVLRNEYINYCKQNIKDFDYAIVIDADLYQIKHKQILEQMEWAPEDWSGLFAYGQFFYPFLGMAIKLRYYDLFAYVPYCSIDNKFSIKELFSNFNKLSKQIRRKQFVECDSGFGGIGVYKYTPFVSSIYSTCENPKRPNLPFICEHALFHKQISKYGKLYICKKLQPLYEPVKSYKTILYMIYYFLRYR